MPFRERMRQNMKKIISLFVIFTFCIMTTMNVDAGTLGLSANTTSVVKGGNVIVTVKATGLAGKFSVTSSNGNVLSGGTSGEWLENETKTYRFTAKNIGSATIKVTPIDVSDSSGNVFTSAKSITINVVAPREKSNNNDLKSLSIEGYQLSPAFSKNTLNYTVDLPSEVTQIKVNATKENGYATLTGDGDINVGEGENKIEITVTSETGNKKIYTIMATVKDLNPIIVNIENKNYTVVKRKDALTAPTDFQEATVKIKDSEIPAYQREGNDLILVGLKDEEGNIKMFSYDEETDTYQEYKSIEIKKDTFHQKEAGEVPEGFWESTIEIDGNTYKAYKKEDTPYVYLYGELLGSNITGWFRYSEKDNSLQLEDINEQKQNVEKDEKGMKDKLILVLGGASIILFIALIIVSVNANKNKKRYKNQRTKE